MIQAFNHLPYHQQIIAVLIQENSDEHPHCMKEHYLWTLAELCTLAIARSAENEQLTSVVTKEVVLGYIAGYFRMRRTLGMFERMASTLEGGAGGGPANIVNAGNGEAARQFDPEYWTRKTQAEDLKNSKAFLQRGLLSVEGIEHFDAWKEDILRYVRSVLLTGRKH